MRKNRKSLQAYRKKITGLTQKEIAEKAGIDAFVYQKFEQKKETKFPLRNATRLSVIFDLSLKEILMFTRETEVSEKREYEKAKENFLKAKRKFYKAQKKMREEN